MRPLPTCTRRLQFCAGHRVMGHENKCAHLHGHNYVTLLRAQQISAQAELALTIQQELKEYDPGLDSIGRVVDFSILKLRIGKWIDKHWDHGFIIHNDDIVAERALLVFQASHPQKIFKLPYNPTAENRAPIL